MSYRLKRDETVLGGLARIARQQAERAALALTGALDPHEGLHEARTSIKKLRALLRLVRPALGDAAYEREDARLRTLGQTLAELRDATVLVETCDALAGHLEKALRPPLERVRRQLISHRSELESRASGPRWRRDTASAFRKVSKRSKQWVASPDADGGWDAIREGLARVYRHGRHGLETAYRDGDADSFHTWRRAVKYHGYHVRLLAAAWPEELEPRLEALEELGQLLGADHDLAVLAGQLRATAESLGDNVKLRLLLRRIAQRQQNLRSRARGLGKSLYLEPTSVFCRRVHLHWRGWRSDGASQRQGPAVAPLPSGRLGRRTSLASEGGPSASA